MSERRPLIRLAAALLCFVAAAPAAAQQTFHACYVPEVGALYLVQRSNLPTDCLSTDHVQISWTESGAAVADGSVTTAKLADGAVTAAKFADDAGEGIEHADLTGLDEDDHPRYVLVDGRRVSTNGFAVSGTRGSGNIPTAGAGTRLMWYPGKAAFRAGEVEGGEWDDANVGEASVAMGSKTTASGEASTAMGNTTTASGTNSTAMGVLTTASGGGSTAMGSRAEASGQVSTATGFLTTASGDFSVAMGRETTASGKSALASGLLTIASGSGSTAMGSRASTNGFDGTFVYGDASTSSGSGVNAQAENSFVVRAQRVWFGKSGDQVATSGRYIETSTGAYLSDGGAWTNASDAGLKENFREEDPDAVLAKVARLPVTSWNYRNEADSVRHLGPTAQDFFAAFGLGDGERAIATVDIAGAALLSIQALERRTTRLLEAVDALQAEVAVLRAENRALRRQSAHFLSVEIR